MFGLQVLLKGIQFQEYMKNNLWSVLIRSSVAVFLLLAVFSTSSMFALAGTPDKRIAGELVVSGGSETDTAFVTVDGERAITGRSVFSSSTIKTPANVGATVNLGKAGRVEIAPNSSLNLNFTEDAISANLIAGQIKVFNAAGVQAKVQTKDETVTADSNQSNMFAVDVSSGVTKAIAETGSVYLSNGAQTGQQTGQGGGLSSMEVLIPVLIFAGIVGASLIYVTTKDGGDTLGSVSPVR